MSTQEELLDSKTCSRCSKVLSIDSFSYDSTNKRYKAGCKKCLSSLSTPSEPTNFNNEVCMPFGAFLVDFNKHSCYNILTQ